MFRTLLAACAFAASLVPPVAVAQGYPSGPIQMVNPYPAGGSVDLLARRLAKHIEDRLKTPVTVVQRMGASGTIAASFVAGARPDGHTLLIGYTNELVISPSLMSVNYTAQSFEPIMFLGSTPFVLIGRRDLPAATLKEVVELGRKGAGLKYGSSGYGSLPHIAGEMLRHEAGMKLQHVPYKGGPQAIADLLGGHVDLVFSGVPGALELIRTDRVKVYGVTDSKRAATLPQVPTMAEAGVKNIELPGWFMLLAPKGTPAGAVSQLRDASAAAVGAPDMQDFFKTNAVAVQPMTPAEVSKFLLTESERYRAIIKNLSITVGN